jgi:hypothetical protein
MNETGLTSRGVDNAAIDVTTVGPTVTSIDVDPRKNAVRSFRARAVVSAEVE